MAIIRQLVFLGPPGSGKGTQAKVLAEVLQLPHVSTGDMFRDNIASGTPLGRQVSGLLKRGQLVPDEVTNQLIKARLEQADARRGFVLDGYPRNLSQAEFLRAVTPDVTVVLLTLPDGEAVKRIARRRTCPVCSTIYHLDYKPPQRSGVCDKDGAKLIQRNDQTEAVVRGRLATYHQLIDPLQDFYRKRGQLVTVDGLPPIAEVTVALMKALGV